jgi:predicted N-acetyltransferase YhbS
MMAVAAQVRRGRPEDVPALAKLSDRVFRPELEPGTGMVEEFPRLFHSDNAANLYFVTDSDDDPVSLVATYHSEIVVNGAKISAISIGSVATLPKHRGQGYASQILLLVMRPAWPHHSVMVVSGSRGLYTRLGCVPFGGLIRIQWRIGGEPNSKLNYRRVQQMSEAAPALHRLYCAEPYRYLRSPAEMQAFLEATRAARYRSRSRGSEVFTAVSQSRLVGYAVIAPGREGNSVDVVEWAGSRLVLLDLIRHGARDFGAVTATWRGQPQDEALAAMLDERGIPSAPVANLGTIAVLNPERLVAEYHPLIYERFGGGLEAAGGKSGFEVAWSAAALAAGMPVPTSPDRAGLARWLFTDQGLNLPLADAGGLNFV